MLRQLIKAIQRRVVFVATLEGSLIFLAVFVVLYTVELYTDIPDIFLWTFPAGLSFVYICIYIYRHNLPLHIVHLVEKTHPFSRERVLSLFEIERKKEARGETSEFLLNQLKEEVREIVNRISPNRVIRFNRLPFFGFFIIVSVSLILFILFPDRFVSSLAGIHPEGFISVLSGDIKVFENNPVTIKAEPLGVRTSSFLFVRSDYVDTSFLPIQEEEVSLFKIQGLEAGNYLYWVKSDRISSDTFRLDVFREPFISGIKAEITPPTYLKIEKETVENPHYLSPIDGSALGLEGELVDGDSIKMVSAKEEMNFVPIDGRFSFYHRITEKERLKFILFKEGLSSKSPYEIDINPIEDGVPYVYLLQPEGDFEVPESERQFFKGYTEDDIGLKEAYLVFIQNLRRDSVLLREWQANSLFDTLFYDFDISKLRLLPGDETVFFIKVIDVKGQIAKSKEVKVRFPTLEEIYSEAKSTSEFGKETFYSVGEETEKLREKLRELGERLKSERELSWSNKEELKSLRIRADSLIKILEKEVNELESAVGKMGERLTLDVGVKEKIEKIRELLREVMTEDIKKALEDLGKALERVDPKMIERALQNLVMNQEELLKSLERMEGILRRFKEEMELLRLKELARELELEERRLMQETESLRDIKILADRKREVAEKTRELREGVKSLGDDLKDRERELSERLEKLVQKVEAMGEEIKETEELLYKGDKPKALQAEGKIAQGFAEVSKSLDEIYNELISRRKTELVRDIKEKREKVIFLSEREEGVMERVNKGTDIEGLAPIEEGISTGLKVVIDELSEIAKTTYLFSPRALGLLNLAYRDITEIKIDMQHRKKGNIKHKIGKVVGYLNLAVLEMLKMEEDISTGGSSTGLESAMKKLSEALKKQLALNQITEGMLPLPFPSQGYEQLARLKAEQEAIKRILEGLTKGGGELEGLLGAVKGAEEEAEKVIKDLESGSLTEGTIKKQEKIIERLLEAQRSIRKRWFTKKRESEPGKEYISEPPLELRSYSEKEKLKRALLNLNKKLYPVGYDRLIESYYRSLLEE